MSGLIGKKIGMTSIFATVNLANVHQNIKFTIKKLKYL
jgi:ribosomal protein L3